MKEVIQFIFLRLKDKLRAADGILLASPEYNGSITAPLKNAIDWASRTEQGAVPAFRNKVTALFASSPGGLGGLRGLNHVRDILSGIGSLVLADQLAVPAIHTKLDEHGRINDADPCACSQAGCLNSSVGAF